MSTEVPNGATQRHARLQEMMTFITLGEPHGRTLIQIQAHLLSLYGLKFKTTAQMVMEKAMAGELKEDGHGWWRITKRLRDAQKEREERLRKRIEAELRPKLEKEIRKRLEKELRARQKNGKRRSRQR